MAICSICGRNAGLMEEVCEGCKNGTTPGSSQVRASRGTRNMIFGLLWFFGGATVTALTLASSSSREGGGPVIYAVGAIVIGFIQFLIGLFSWLMNRNRED